MSGPVLAVDIGAHGAAALLDEAGDLLAVEDLPTLDSGPSCRPEISPHLFATIVRRWSPSRAWVEWKRACSIPPGRDMKDLARARAIERWPRRAELFGRVKDHDRAEAALIGWAGLQRERAGR